MTKVSTTRNDLDRSPNHGGAFVDGRPRTMLATLAVAILTAVAGCQTTQTNAPVETATSHSEAIVLREGDVLKITFPGAPNLNDSQQIRRDGKIALSMVGEVVAAGLNAGRFGERDSQTVLVPVGHQGSHGHRDFFVVSHLCDRGGDSAGQDPVRPPDHRAGSHHGSRRFRLHEGRPRSRPGGPDRESGDEELHAEPEGGVTGQAEHAVLLETFRHRVRAGEILLVLAAGRGGMLRVSRGTVARRDNGGGLRRVLLRLLRGPLYVQPLHQLV